MQNLYKTLGALTIAAAIMFGSFQTADAAKRRVVVEDHTGAWCGWCVRGTQVLRELSEEYGDDFIPVAVHNGDAMADANIQTPLAQKIGLTGYPSGSVNRMLFSGQAKVVLSDGAWASVTKIVFDTPALNNVWADVDLEWSLTPQGQLSANVTVTADADANGEFGINLYVMEDGVTGSGSGYNQQNYLSGRAGFEGHYYYDQPAVIQDYVHDNVLRYMLSGYDGKLAPIAKTVIKAGDKFSELFQQNISSKIQNVDNVWVVAVVHNLSNSNYEIVNAKMAGKKLPTVAKVELAGDGELNNRHDAGTKVTETITVTNPNDFEITVDMTVNGTTSIIPNGWSTEFSKNSLTIPANGTATTELTLNTGNSAGFSQVVVKAEARSVDEIKGKSASINVFSLSNSTKNAFILTSNNIVPALNSFNQLTSVMSESAVIPYSNDIANAYPFADFDMVILSTDNTNRGILAQNGVMAGALNSALQAGKKVLLNGTIEAFFATGNPISGVNVASEAKALYATLGVRTYNPASPTVIFTSSGNSIIPTPTPVVADGNDVLFSGLNFTINQYNSQNHPYYAQWVDSYAITNTATTESFLNYTIAGQGKDATIAGVKVTLANGGKAILTGFGFDIISDANARASLMSKSIQWLNATTSTAPKMVLSTDMLDFGKVGAATDLDFEVSNTGNAELVIDEASISLDNDAAFSVKTLSTNKVAAGAKTKIVVTYTPVDGKLSTGVLTVKSNDGSKTVALTGQSAPNSVDDYLANTGLFVMNVTPNPVASQSVFQYELNSNSAENVELKLIDANGNVVAKLFNGIQTPGTHTINLDANKYANGKYFIIANLLGHSAQFPVVVAK